MSFNNDYFKILPSDINFIYFYNDDIRDVIYPFFNLIGTNFYKLDRKYFDAYFSETVFSQQTEQIYAAKIDSKATNIIRIVNIDSQTNYMNMFPAESPETTYLEREIFKNEQGYYVFMSKKLVISRKLNFLKKAIQAYKKRRGFYFTKNFKKIQAYRNKNFLLWMDLRKYLTDKALKYKKDKWAYYNAYIKTFDKMIIYSDRKDRYFYLKLVFY